MLLGEFSGMMVAIGCIWWLIGSEHERWLTVSIKMKVLAEVLRVTAVSEEM